MAAGARPGAGAGDPDQDQDPAPDPDLGAGAGGVGVGPSPEVGGGVGLSLGPSRRASQGADPGKAGGGLEPVDRALEDQEGSQSLAVRTERGRMTILLLTGSRRTS